MLTPIKKQGDEHIYILLKIGIIDGYQFIMWIFLGSSGCSLVQKLPMATLFLSSMKFAAKAITQIETRFF